MRFYSKKFIWGRSRTRKLIRMKKTGHRSYIEISRKIGCSPKVAKEKYMSI